MTITLLNYAQYQIGWLIIVISASWAQPWLGMALALTLVCGHILLCRTRGVEFTLVILTGSIGLLVDSVNAMLGVLSFSTGTVDFMPCPPWIVVMWMQFATTFRHCLRWLVGRPGLTALCGAVGGPLAYVLGTQFGVVSMGPPMILSLGILALVWAITLPLLMWLAGRHARTGYRFWSYSE